MKYELHGNGSTRVIRGGLSANTDVEGVKIANFQADNYTYECGDDYIVLHYTKCRDSRQMSRFIEEVDVMASNRGYDKCIVDIRGNSGGNDGPGRMLCNFLEGRFAKLVSLVDERVYSSGICACVDLSKINAYTIGTDIGDSPCTFGDVVAREFSQYNLRIRCSQRFIVAGLNQARDIGYAKEAFARKFHTPADLPEF